MKDQLIFILLILVVATVICGVFGGFYRMSEDVAEFTVKRTERVTYGDKSKYLVWSQEGEVFENTDTFMFMKFNSSDVYGDLENGKKVCARVAGWRNHFLSWYRNIIKLVPCGG